LLSVDELALVAKTHHPALGELSGHDLRELCRLVRERRDRTREIAARQRREMRGKAAPRGVRSATDDTGTRAKKELLGAAVQRLNKEVARREARASRQALMENAALALRLRRSSEAEAPHPDPGRTPNEGIRSKGHASPPSPRNLAKQGAIAQQTRNMQAKRDSR